MFARVIVDVPSRQTDRPYDYKIPAFLNGFIDVGSRVKVPFGSRVVQGFVVDLYETSEIEQGKIKEIVEAMDAHPPLTPELVRLSEWMSEKYVCRRIAALQAMIPAALKAKYERRIFPAEGLGDQLGSMDERERRIADFLLKRQSVPLDDLLEAFPQEAALIRKMIGKGWLYEEQNVKNRLFTKKVLTVFPPKDRDALSAALASVPANARKQQELLRYFLEHPDPIPCSELLSFFGAGYQTVRSMAEKGWIELKEVEVFRDPYARRAFAKTAPLSLTPEQQEALRAVTEGLDGNVHQPFLLHGVTGSGKTEVYLQAIESCLSRGKEAIVLVPEISLTPQMVERFKGRFGDQVAVLHSRLSHGERYDEWRKIQEKRVKVAIGARSAIFAPFTRLGLIIIDEEHESSYKQEEAPKYHARDVALWRGEFHRCVVLLGSATPSLESYYHAQHGEKNSGTVPWKLLSMPSRVEGRPLPSLRIVDMREELRSGNRSMFSRPLLRALEERLSRREQTVLLLNRRGYSTFVLCRSCGGALLCPHCDISLTYHRGANVLRCHYCGYAQVEVRTCPNCQSPHIRHFGTGTQRVEEELTRLFPGIRIIRMDTDTTTEKGSHEKWLTLFRNKEADVLLGTQMVAKGLDFPDVTLVGVISADLMLHLPDFRAAERTFQLLTQVSGRAGRHRLPGEVFFQTYAPDHYSVVYAGNHDYDRFFQTELALRKQRKYPPYCRLVLITLSHEQVPLLVRAGEALVNMLNRMWADKLARDAALRAAGCTLEVLGPVASPIGRIKDRYRFQCMIKYQGEFHIGAMLKTALDRLMDWAQDDRLAVSADVDPQIMM